VETPLKLFTSSILRYSGLSDDEDEDLSGEVRKWTLKVTKHDVTVLEYGRGKLPLLCRFHFTFTRIHPISLVHICVPTNTKP
jgi:hypothetical protein